MQYFYRNYILGNDCNAVCVQDCDLCPVDLYCLGRHFGNRLHVKPATPLKQYVQKYQIRTLWQILCFSLYCISNKNNDVQKWNIQLMLKKVGNVSPGCVYAPHLAEWSQLTKSILVCVWNQAYRGCGPTPMSGWCTHINYWAVQAHAMLWKVKGQTLAPSCAQDVTLQSKQKDHLVGKDCHECHPYLPVMIGYRYFHQARH